MPKTGLDSENEIMTVFFGNVCILSLGFSEFDQGKKYKNNHKAI